MSALDRRIVALALPALGALTVEPLYNLVDTGIVGHLGRSPLGGLALAGSVLNLLGWCTGFLSMATTSAVAFRHGRDDAAGAARAAGAAYLVAVLFGVVLAGAVWLVGPAAVGLLGGTGAIRAAGVTYLRVAAVGVPFLLVGLAGNGHLVGLADTRRPLLITGLATVVNVAAEVGLVYGAHAGIAGSAWGTVGAQVVTAGCFLAASRRASAGVGRRPRAAEVRRLLVDGGRLVVRTAALGAALLASTAVAARLGPDRLGGHQIGLQVWLLLALVLDALAVPAQVFVGQALGRDDPATAAAVGERTLRMGLLAGVVVGLVTVAAAPVLPLVFSADGGVDRSATVALVGCGLLQPVAALAFVYDGLLLGASAYTALRGAMLAALAAFAPLAALTLLLPGLGLVGVWAALACWLAARAGLLARHWGSRRWAPRAAVVAQPESAG